jgi:hypothetical protein
MLQVGVIVGVGELVDVAVSDGAGVIVGVGLGEGLGVGMLLGDCVGVGVGIERVEAGVGGRVSVGAVKTPCVAGALQAASASIMLI